jgi:hypothetical protein
MLQFHRTKLRRATVAGRLVGIPATTRPEDVDVVVRKALIEAAPKLAAALWAENNPETKIPDEAELVKALERTDGPKNVDKLTLVVGSHRVGSMDEVSWHILWSIPTSYEPAYLAVQQVLSDLDFTSALYGKAKYRPQGVHCLGCHSYGHWKGKSIQP